MQKSWRHHYLPQFYLKGFTNDSGKFKIYDVEREVFLKNGKDFTPSSFFYEKNGNSLESPEIDSEYIESFYQQHETPAADTIRIINENTSDNKYGVTPLKMVELMYFISQVYYRLPHYKEATYRAFAELKYEKVGLQIVDKNTGTCITDKAQLGGIMGHPDMSKMTGLAAPTFMYQRFITNTNKHLPRIIPRQNQTPPIISDNPFLFEDEEKCDIYDNPFIFPLSSSRLLLNTPDYNGIWSNIEILVDCLIFKQAKKYVACPSKEYVEALDKYYNEEIKTMGNLRKTLFQTINFL